jgi:hypothetical protein
MMGAVEPVTEAPLAARSFPRALRAHPFVVLLIVGVLLGGGLRLVPTSAAAGSGQGASTACAAK